MSIMNRQCDSCGRPRHLECICYSPGKDRVLEEEALIDSLSPVVLDVCRLCREGVAGECHTPGCAFWMHAAPEFKLVGTLTRDEMIEQAMTTLNDFIATQPVLWCFSRSIATSMLLEAGVIPYIKDGDGQ